MSDQPERTIEKGVERLNSVFSTRLKDSQIAKQSVGYEHDPRSRLVITPKDREEHGSDYKSTIGEAYTDDELQAFIRGLEVAGMGDIPVKSEYTPYDDAETVTVELYKLDIGDTIIAPSSGKRVVLADYTQPEKYQGGIWTCVTPGTEAFVETIDDESQSDDPTKVEVHPDDVHLEDL